MCQCCRIEWLSIPQSLWHTWPSAVKKESGPRVLMPGVSTSKWHSRGRTAPCPPCCSLEWAWLTLAPSMYLINTYWENKLGFSEIALAISWCSLSITPQLEVQGWLLKISVYLLCPIFMRHNFIKIIWILYQILLVICYFCVDQMMEILIFDICNKRLTKPTLLYLTYITNSLCSPFQKFPFPSVK